MKATSRNSIYWYGDDWYSYGEELVR